MWTNFNEIFWMATIHELQQLDSGAESNHDVHAAIFYRNFSTAGYWQILKCCNGGFSNLGRDLQIVSVLVNIVFAF